MNGIKNKSCTYILTVAEAKPLSQKNNFFLRLFCFGTAGVLLKKNSFYSHLHNFVNDQEDYQSKRLYESMRSTVVVD